MVSPFFSCSSCHSANSATEPPRATAQAFTCATEDIKELSQLTTLGFWAITYQRSESRTMAKTVRKLQRMPYFQWWIHFENEETFASFHVRDYYKINQQQLHSSSVKFLTRRGTSQGNPQGRLEQVRKMYQFVWWMLHCLTSSEKELESRIIKANWIYGGTCLNDCLTTFILPPTKTFCPYKIIPATKGGETIIWARTSVRQD
jgi:hypothetical protein